MWRPIGLAVVLWVSLTTIGEAGLFEGLVGYWELNGNFVDSTTIPGTLNTTESGLSLGGSNAYGYQLTRAFSGALDEVALWNRALSANEIARAYDLGLAGQSLLVPEPGGLTGMTMGLLALLGLAVRRAGYG